jgi:hypothetical protein
MPKVDTIVVSIDRNDPVVAEANYIAVIGDVHGCLNELQALVAKLPPKTAVFLTGDLVDRGPNSNGVIDHCIGNNCYSVLGNHDEKALRYHRRGPGAMMTDTDFMMTTMVLKDRHYEYLERLPHVYRIDLGTRTRTITHAGFTWGSSNKNANGVIRTRYLKWKDTRWVMARCEAPDYEPPPDGVFWADIWAKNTREIDNRIIYGHEVAVDGLPRLDKTPEGYLVCVGVDTGCVFGHALTAYVEDIRTGKHWFESVDSKFDFVRDAWWCKKGSPTVLGYE